MFCKECQSKIKFIDDEIAISWYEGVMKKAIRLLKFHNKKAVSEILGQICFENIGKSDFDLIIPVPLHRKRLNSRGYNQCSLIGKVLAEKLKTPLITDVLIRVRDTKPQFALKRKERLSNVKGAFDVKNTGKINGKRVLLLDDIYTTGATVSECKIILERADALAVIPFTICKA